MAICHSSTLAIFPPPVLVGSPSVSTFALALGEAGGVSPALLAGAACLNTHPSYLQMPFLKLRHIGECQRSHALPLVHVPLRWNLHTLTSGLPLGEVPRGLRGCVVAPGSLASEGLTLPFPFPLLPGDLPRGVL